MTRSGRHRIVTGAVAGLGLPLLGSIIGDGCWINRGATMHGTQIADGGAVGLNACRDYNTRIGKGVIPADGSSDGPL
jgi:carbonic anhydrase/acetyltransferase-like protein (isoleucine patch superfamily)